jgi:riboflavin kinase/FMN adenylyltransferase
MNNLFHKKCVYLAQVTNFLQQGQQLKLKTNHQTIKIVGKVTYGNGLGHKLGFPTANIEPQAPLEGVAEGVWAGYATVGSEDYMAVVNIGRSPSVVESGRLRVEVHIIGFEGNLYNKELSISLLEHLRPEQKFPSKEALVEQIARDKAQAIALLTQQ